MTIISVSPRDPLIIRDGRPFGGEGNNRMRSLSWPYPSTIAGAIRTLLGTELKGEEENPFDDERVLLRLKQTSVLGPLPMSEEELYFPSPADIIYYEKGKQCTALYPVEPRKGEGCNLPNKSLWPVKISDDRKPQTMPFFWPYSSLLPWLIDHNLNEYPYGLTFIMEERIHAAIGDTTGTADEGNLFATEALVISDLLIPQTRQKYDGAGNHFDLQSGVTLGVKVDSDDEEINEMIKQLDTISPFGGERRLSHFRTRPTSSHYWQCPPALRQALLGAETVRMILATPAIFSGGWLPGWLNADTLEGTPPGTSVRLRLRGGCVQRWKPISGWNLEKKSFGPKPVRRLTPAGSVYFFEVLSGQSEDLAGLWLKPVSDEEQDRKDGFGLSLWGIWKHKCEE